MSNYSKSVNFAVKDTLQSGDPNKIVSGAEIDTEFNNISSASTTKIDKVPAAQVNNIAVFTATGALQDSGKNLDEVVPTGVITMWSGGIISVPSGWALCDGSNGTPDLRDRFIVAAGGNYSPNDIGGLDSVSLTESELPSHTHTMNTAGSHSHSGSTNTTGDHRHDIGFSDFEGSHYGETSVSSNNKEAGWGSAQRDSGSARTNTTGAHSHSLSINSNGNHTHNIYNTGGGNSHDHGITHNGNWRPAYADVIVCERSK